MKSAQLEPVRPYIPTPPAPRRSPWGLVVRLVHGLLVLGAAGFFVFAVAHFVHNAKQPKRVVVPATMEDVDWTSPESSVYCLSCHRPVGRAAAGTDVQRGHSQNVALNDVQLRAVRDMGTITGPGNTLICMSCHKLDPNGTSYMLADTLEGSQLCQRCHPGHYAQNTPHDLRQSAPNEQNRLGMTVADSGPCSACHLAHSFAREILPSPLDPDGWCISCHREYAVAAGHAHTEVMHHPESHCLQCHNPHDMSHGEFLKQSPPGLCLECHESYDAGVARGMHPMLKMDKPLPKQLVDAGGSAGLDGMQLTCGSCHAVHKAGHEQLLVLTSKTNELCLACHEDKLAAHGEGVLPKHGQSPILNDAQRAVVASWGTPVGDNGELLCISCHKVHNAEPQANLLALRPKYGETCTACHPDQAGIVGTLHDLTIKFPNGENKLGLTPAGAGVCSPCHTAHQFPRERVPGPGDTAGQCLSCHLAGRIAQNKSSSGAEHPKTGCAECHNPHDRTNARFLRKPEPDLCASCHADQMRLRGGPHDITKPQVSARWNAAAREHGGLCLSCHVPHGGERPDLFRVANGESVGNHDEVCLACHADTAWNAPEVGAIHPQHISPEQKKVELALVPHDAEGNLRMGCRTCHNPHGGADPVHLARVEPGKPTESLCLHCHAEKELIKHTGHSAEKLGALKLDTDSCKPCHAMHADREGSWGQMLSTRFLPRCEPSDQADCAPCIACHRQNGPAPFQKVASHPERPMATASHAEDAGHLPLFNAQGREDPQGQVVCRTCHVSHGRLDLLKVMAENPNMTPEQKHAMRAQIRPFTEPNTCTGCHGPQARRMFLRFHDAEDRKPEPTPGAAPRQ